MVDAAIGISDVAMPATDALSCFGSGLSRFCIVAPTGPVSVTTAMVIDTSTSPMCLPYSGDDAGRYCVIAGSSLDISSTFDARGARELVLIGSSSIVISGTLTVASHRTGAVRGAGSSSVVCVAAQSATNGAGGAGGSFGGRGGSGGLGENGNTRPASAPTVDTVSSLRAGCRGGSGTNGAGGYGGGAIQLIAGTSITIMTNGTINASGAGGGRSTLNDNGGGGGGSGGMIVLEAPTIVNSGQVLANGGGGGAGNQFSEDGGEPTSALVAAPGGRDLAHAGDGGPGAAAASRTGGNGHDGIDGGGGGGGGAGIIRVFPPQSIGGRVSPAAT